LAIVNISGEFKAFATRNETLLVLLLCFLAVLRVLIFSAAFPFFSNIDEDLHFDLITQYSEGRLPRVFEPLKEESLSWIVPYASPEVLVHFRSVSVRKIPAAFMEDVWTRS